MSKIRKYLFPILLLAACHQQSFDPASANETRAEEAQGGDLRTGLVVTSRGLEDLTYQWIDGEAIYQGDIVLPMPGTTRTWGVGQTAAGFRWPNQTVPYVIDSALT